MTENPMPPATTTSVLPVSGWQWIDNADVAWKFWSLRIQGFAASLLAIYTALPDSVQATIPPRLVTGIIAFVVLTGGAARLVKQGNVPSVADLNEPPKPFVQTSFPRPAGQ